MRMRTSPAASVEQPSRGGVTWMAGVTRFLLLLTPATIHSNYTTVAFRLCSVKTLVYCVCYFGLVVALWVIATSFDININISEKNTAEMNFVDISSQIPLWVMAVNYMLTPFLVAAGMPSIPHLVLAADIKWPKYGMMVVCSTLAISSANITCKYEYQRITLF